MTEQDQSIRTKAANSGRWTAASAFTSVVLQFAQAAILGRLLGPNDFGLMAMMMLIIGLFNSISDFGLGNYLVQKEILSKQTILKTIIIVIAGAVLLSFLILISSAQIAGYYKQPLLNELLPWLSILIIAFAISQILASVLQRFFSFREIAIGEIISAGMTLISSTLLAMYGYHVWSLVIGQIVGGVVRIFCFSMPFIRLVKKLPDENRANFSKAKNFIIYQTGERMLNYMGHNLDKAIIGRMLGAVDLGLYSLAYQLMTKPYSVLNPIFTRVSFPLFANIRHENARLADGYLKTIKTIAILTFPIYMILATCSPLIIEILMGEQWIDAAPILYVLSLLGIFFSIGNPVGVLILAKGKPEWAFNLNIFSLFVYGIAFWIGSHYSAIGVAIAFLVSCVFFLYPIEFYLRYKLVGMSVAQYFLAMRHLFIAFALPIFAHGCIYLYDLNGISTFGQIFCAVMEVIFFYGYLYVCDRSLIRSTINIIFKGK